MDVQRGIDGDFFQGDKQDLQKDFHRILQEKGAVGAAQMLIERYTENPNYALREGLRLSTQLNDKLGSILEEQQNMIVRTSAMELLAQLQLQYRDLSDRQHTKIGFEQFVHDYLDKIQEGGTTEEREREEEFVNLVLQGAGKQEWAGQNEETKISVRRRPYHLDYRRESIDLQKKLGAMYAEYQEIQDALSILADLSDVKDA